MSGPPCHNSSPPDPSLIFLVAFVDRADVVGASSAQRVEVGTSSLGCAELPRNHPTSPGERCQSRMFLGEVKVDVHMSIWMFPIQDRVSHYFFNTKFT